MRFSVNVGDIVEFQRTLGNWVPAVVETVYSNDCLGMSILYRGKWEFRNVERGDKTEQWRSRISTGFDDAKTEGGLHRSPSASDAVQPV